MTSPSSPQSQSYRWPSPQRSSAIEEILGEDRNSEARHRQLLEAAKREHDRVREDAERVYRLQLQKEERQRVLDEIRREEERVRREEQLAAERVRLNAIKAKEIAIPPPLPDPKPPAAQPVNGRTAAGANAGVSVQDSAARPAPGQANGNATQGQTASVVPPSSNPFAAKPQSGATLAAHSSAQPPVAAQSKAAEPARPSNSALGIGSLLNGTTQANGVRSDSGTSRSAPQSSTQTTPDRYTEIHRNLKGLRKFMAEQCKANPALKARMGDMRREIRKSVGQLTVASGVPGTNKTQQQKIVTLLREALSNQVQSQLMDPSNFVLEPRNPVQGAVHNDPALPSIFLYLLNIFSKAAISQFINEAGARPETADPVGVCVAATFSESDFLWRGTSMIDILLAKFRVVCPVLFGYRGSEKTQQGRQRLGWWKDGGQWVPEQQHMDRMTGLGAGFAAISLRKFVQSKKENPYPARNYWAAMARIVNTPPEEISNTQCVVLKSMIQNYEQKFIEFYGTAAIAALRTALVEFPARAPLKSAAVNSVEVLAQLLKRDAGLVLE
ncbi:Nucleoporin GLE1 [Madurella mycetomatis]|uniref:mRNA export factor GLE1 n=1 Tax=Madurella mycetomatis TaxID=100816 RepID=A0A175W1C3_9PEZI|nr:Nucleoporin GLE1 [Madurella mycetomatis]